MRYLNVGCGKKFSKDSIWENVDMVSSNRKYVRQHNLIKGFPYENNSFEAVYHSQVLEHIPKENAKGFLNECFRVLKDGGVIRVVVPDLENIVNEYLTRLKENLVNPSKYATEAYHWAVFELYDQAVRNKSGGLTTDYYLKNKLFENKYVNKRTGIRWARARENENETKFQKIKRVSNEIGRFNLVVAILRIIKQKVLNFLLGKKYRTGSFRHGGEIHYWMYDRFSLSELLKEVGFKEIKVKTAYTSDILNWEKYELDVKGNTLYDPTSLFMEARK